MDPRKTASKWLGPAKTKVCTPFSKQVLPTEESETYSSCMLEQSRAKKINNSNEDEVKSISSYFSSNQSMKYGNVPETETKDDQVEQKYTEIPAESHHGVYSSVCVLRKGGFLWKVPYHSEGPPRRRWFKIVGGKEVDGTALRLEWHDPSKSTTKPRSILFLNILEIVMGQNTQSFVSQGRIGNMFPASQCFSIITKKRTLDLVANSKREVNTWLDELSQLMNSINRPLDSSMSRLEGSSGTFPDNFSLVDSNGNRAKKLKNSKSTKALIKEIFYHCYRNDVDAVAKLLEKGIFKIDTLESKENGDSILVVACRLGCTQIAELCLRYGAANDPHPEYGQTALQAAVYAGQYECAKLILDTAAPSRMNEIIVNHADSRKNAPIHLASLAGDDKMLKLLLKNGADICAVDINGRTSMHCSCSTKKGHYYETVLLLIEYSDDCGEDLINLGDNNSWTPLHTAVTFSDVRVVKLLLESAADPRYVNSENMTAYQLALSKGHPEVMALLREYEAWYDRDKNKFDQHRHVSNVTNDSYLHNFHDNYNGNHEYDFGFSNQQIENQGYISGEQEHRANKISLESNYYHEHQNIDNFNYHSDVDSTLFELEKWERHYTEEGYCYYYCCATGEWQWEAPSSEQRKKTVKIVDGAYYEENYSQDEESKITVDSAPSSQQMYDTFVDSRTTATYRYEVSLDTADYEKAQHLKPSKLGERIRAELQRARKAERTMQQNQNQTNTHNVAVTCEPNEREYTQNRSVDSEILLKRMTEGPSEVNASSTIAQPNPITRNSSNVPTGQERVENETCHTEKTHIFENKDSKKEENAKGTDNEQVQQVLRPDNSIAEPEGVKSNSCDVFPAQGAYQVPLSHGIERIEISQSTVLHTNPSTSTAIKESKLTMNENSPDVNSLLMEIKAKGGIESTVDEKTRYSENEEDTAKTGKSIAEKEAAASIELDNKQIDINELELETYISMKKYGVSDGSISQKMLSEGKSQQEIEYVLKQNVSPEKEKDLKLQKKEIRKDACLAVEATAPTPPAASASKRNLKPQAELVKEIEADRKYAKYLKMKKMGIHVGAIKNGMVRDGLDNESVENFLLAFDPSLATSTMSKQTRKRDGPDLLKLRWKPLSSDSLKDTVWAEASNQSSLCQDDLKALEDIFATKPAAKKVSGKLQKPKQRQKRLFDMKRENNVGIGLSRIKKAFPSYSEVARAIRTADLSKLKLDILELLLQLLPTQDEKRKLLDFKGDLNTLGEVPKFFGAVAPIENAADLVEFLLFQTTFCDRLLALRKKMNSVISACSELQSSSKLKRVLELILSVGNAMNQGTNHGGAKGFTLDSLTKLVETKGNDRKTTVLDYVAKMAIKKEGELMNLGQDFRNLKEASNIRVSELRRQIRKIKNDLDKFNKKLNNMENLDAKFTENVNNFFENAQTESDGLTSIENEVNQKLLLTLGYFNGREEVEGLNAQAVDNTSFCSLLSFIIKFDKACTKNKRYR